MSICFLANEVKEFRESRIWIERISADKFLSDCYRTVFTKNGLLCHAEMSLKFYVSSKMR